MKKQLYAYKGKVGGLMQDIGEAMQASFADAAKIEPDNSDAQARIIRDAVEATDAEMDAANAERYSNQRYDL
jgi:hypothetical protein